MHTREPHKSNDIYWKVMDDCNRLRSEKTPSLPKSEKRKRLPKRRPCLPRTKKSRTEK